MANKLVCEIAGCINYQLCRGFCSKHYQRWKRHGDPLAGGTEIGAPLLFLKEVASAPPETCVVWPYATTPPGYGQLRVAGTMHPAHRLSWEIHHGREMADDMEAAHEPIVCHNRACINPLHIREATRADNIRDMHIDNTDSRGERHGGSKLRIDQVRAIKSDTRRTSVIARELGVAWSTIDDIRRGRNWGWLS